MNESRVRSIRTTMVEDLNKAEARMEHHLVIVRNTDRILPTEKADLYLMPGSKSGGQGLAKRRGTVKLAIHHLTLAGISLSDVLPDKCGWFYKETPIRPMHHWAYTYCGYLLFSNSESYHDPVHDLEGMLHSAGDGLVMSNEHKDSAYTVHFYYVPNLVIRHFTTDGRSLDRVFSDRVHAMELGKHYAFTPPVHAEYAYVGYYTAENGDISYHHPRSGHPEPYTYEGGGHPKILYFYYRHRITGVNCAVLLPQTVEEETDWRAEDHGLTMLPTESRDVATQTTKAYCMLQIQPADQIQKRRDNDEGDASTAA